MVMLGSMFAAAAEAYGEKGLGGMVTSDIEKIRARHLLEEKAAADKAAAAAGKPPVTPASATSGGGTPYSDDPNKPGAGTPYVAPKTETKPKKPEFETIKGDPSKGGPPPNLYTNPWPGASGTVAAPASAIPTTSTPSALQGVINEQFPGFSQPAPTGSILNISEPTIPKSGKYPWFIPQSWTNPQKTNPDTGPVIGGGGGPMPVSPAAPDMATGTGPGGRGSSRAFTGQRGGVPAQPQLGDVANGHVLTSQGWVPAPQGTVTPGTTQAIVPPV